jgi:hypothetical protein
MGLTGRGRLVLAVTGSFGMIFIGMLHQNAAAERKEFSNGIELPM